MSLMRPWLLFLLCLPGLAFAALPQPTSLKIDGLNFSWSPVEGASLYRVAVWQGKRALVSAAWIKTANWTYGDKDAVVPKAGKLASTLLPSLNPRTPYRLWIAAANAQGLEKSAWAVMEFTAPASSQASAAVVTPTATPSPTPGIEEIPVIEFREKPAASK
jgi:hypothetical protein